jgi:hypothetical protein
VCNAQVHRWSVSTAYSIQYELQAIRACECQDRWADGLNDQRTREFLASETTTAATAQLLPALSNISI